jgi:hypothetical protein
MVLITHLVITLKKDKSEDTNGIISSHTSEDRKYNGKQKKGSKDKQFVLFQY